MSEILSIALAGNPNAGKTTAFNALTGAHQHVANYPGITVEQKEGDMKLKDGTSIRIIDLPGTYSLTPYSPEELVARRVLTQVKPDAAIVVINSTVLERNLYLTVQLLEMGIPVTIALNMIDEATANGVRIDAKLLAQRLNTIVIPTIARNKTGLTDLLEETVKKVRTEHGKPWSPLVLSYGVDVDTVLETITQDIDKVKLLADLAPAHWIALKLIEGDIEILQLCKKEQPILSAQITDQIKLLENHLRGTLNTTPEGIIADYRYGFIASLLAGGVITREEELQKRLSITDRMDRVLTHVLAGPLIMIALLYSIYDITFTLGEYPMGWVGTLFEALAAGTEHILPNGMLKSLILNGIIGGVGGVMGFVPLIMIMFLQISILEDSGYMARMAYMLDRVFKYFGLHGCSVMPFIIAGGIAGGCAVPAVMATRTLRSPKEKLATIITLPFMACGAKLPVFLLFVGVFFQTQEATIMLSLTLLGWATALLTSLALRKTIIRGPSTPFVMELPPYRFPTFSGIFIHTGERTWQYIKKAGTIILAVSILLWAAMTYPQMPEELITDESKRTEQILQYTAAGRLGVAMEPFTAPLGFNWRTDIALIGGFAAKEVIVATLGTAYSLEELDEENPQPLAELIRQDPQWDPGTVWALLVFVMLYAPCFVTIAVIKQETQSWGWALFAMFGNTGIAYGAALLAKGIANAFV